MNATNNSKQQLSEIHNLMERSSRFISLSGLSGVSAGVVALAGALFAYFYLNFDVRYFDIDRYFTQRLYANFEQKILILLLDAILVLSFAIGSAIFFTTRRAKQKGLKIWTHSTRLMLYHLFIPLGTGAVFCVILFTYKLIFLLAPVTLIFYGLALLNASKFTLPEIQWLGISEIILGLIAALFVGYGLVFWALGFGILHILYGIVMYNRYERK